jgi:probable HAF family extracellular repeat protein
MYRRALLFGVLLCLAVTGPSYALSYTFYGIRGDGGVESNALAINDAGQVTGTTEYANGSGRGFLWQGGSTLDLLTPGPYSDGVAINNAGLIGGRAFDFVIENGAPCAWYGGPGAPPATVFGLPGAVRDLNDAGVIVGDVDDYTGYTLGFRFDGALQVLATLGGTSCSAQAINNLGQAVGWSYTNDPYTGWQAAVWGADGSPFNLGALLVPGWSDATDINDAGVVTGNAQLMDVSRAYVYNGGTVSYLNPLAAAASCGALGINESGDVVGRAIDGHGMERACLWSGGEVYDLNTFLPGDSGWELLMASDINERGDIVGFASGPDHRGWGYALIRNDDGGPSIPEPSSLALFGIGLGALVLRRRRKRA